MSVSRRNFLAGAAATAALAGCTPGMSGGDVPAVDTDAPVSKDVRGAGRVTLTVWDQNTQGGIGDAQEKLNAEFEKRYPNVTINRVVRQFSDLKATLRLALSSDDPPDAVQANQGYPDMGAFVQGGLIQNVDRYAKAYGWNERYPKQLLSLNSFSSDGTKWQDGPLYGISQTGEIVGVYYNKAVLDRLGVDVPTTFEQFRAILPKAKQAKLVPISFGDSDKSPGIHIFGTAQANTASKQAVRGLVTSTSGTWSDKTTLDAAEIIAEWGKSGYLTPGANGLTADQAVERFGKGAGPFLITGTWQLATVAKALGKDAGFLALAARSGAMPVAEGGIGLAWAITTRTKHPDVAAAYLDFITGARASQVLIDTGNLPAVFPAGYQPKPGTLAGDISIAWRRISTGDGLVPYLDYATPTFYDTLSGAVQQLTSGAVSPKEFVDSLDQDRSTFLASR